MDDGLLLWREPRRQQMRVDVAPEEDGLKEQETRRPHAGPATKPRQDEFPDQRLDGKKQKRAGEDREGEGLHLEEDRGADRQD